MTAFSSSVLPRRRGNFLLKVVAITIFLWLLLVFGFSQTPESDVGEHLDRHRLDEARFSKITRKHQTSRPVQQKLARKDNKKQDVGKPERDKIVKEFLNSVETTRKLLKPIVTTSLATSSKKPAIAKVVKSGKLNEKKKTVKHILNILAKGSVKKDEPKKVEVQKKTKTEHKKDEKVPHPAIEKVFYRDLKPELIHKVIPKTMTTKKASPLKYTKFSPPPNIFNSSSLGEMGVAVEMPKELPAHIKKIYDDGWKKNEFNQYLSDLISFHRKLPDYRSDWCKEEVEYYSKKLPATSVIIIFYNEAWSTLLRSVHSVIDRSPNHLISEIILVDDFSTMDHLKQPLDDYFSDYPKVKIVRSTKREGLIRARLKGTVVAKGPVLTFLDSHIECMTGWLEPLLDRIAQNVTNVAVPMIDGINEKTFKFEDDLSNLDEIQIGGFDWGLIFRWDSIPESEKKRKKDPSEPTRSPTMAGGLFSIDKAYFEKLGTYDPGFDIWGAENLELSFKTWMCGGTLEIIPCSHVGHIYRDKSPYSWRKGKNTLKTNLMRLAEVWLDDYKQYFYVAAGKGKHFGDISQRVQLRKDLKCKSFEWYLQNVYPTQNIPSDGIAYGEIRNAGYGNNTCLDADDSLEQDPVAIRCHKHGGNQYWEYKDGQICRVDLCLQYIDSKVVTKFQTDELASVFTWSFDNNTKQLRHNPTKQCLAMSKSHVLVMQECNEEEPGQKWTFERLRPERLK